MRLRVFACALALAGMIVGGFGLAPHATAACTNKKAPVVTDPAGDANGFVEQGIMPTSEAALDILKGTVKFKGKKKMLTFTIDVASMGEVQTSTGQFFRFWFSTQGVDYQLDALTDVVNGQEFSLSILGQEADDVGYVSIADIEGQFNAGKNQVTMRLPLKRFNKAVSAYFEGLGQAAPKPLKKGGTLGGFSILAQRYYNLVAIGFTPSADEAEGECLYVLGKGVTG